MFLLALLTVCVNMYVHTQREKTKMSIFKKVIKEVKTPAITIVTLATENHFNIESETVTPFINLVAGDKLTLKNSLTRYSINSCVAYALSNNSCPIKAYNRAISLNQKTHWISQEPVVVSSSEQKPETIILVDYETVYKIEGKFFNISDDFNDNLKMVMLDLD